jgi:hypothetical protein
MTTTKHVTKTITVPVTITWNATEVSDETGAHVEMANLLSIDVEGAYFEAWDDVVVYMRDTIEAGDWE